MPQNCFSLLLMPRGHLTSSSCTIFGATSWVLICIFAFRSLYNSSMGEMKRSEAREVDQRSGERFGATLVIAAAIIAAVRLVREDISRPSPRLLSGVADSISLARTILDGVLKRYPRA